MEKTIFEVLRDTGYATRKSALFADNYNRIFTLKGEGDVILIKINNSVAGKLPKLEGEFEFNLLTKITNASREEAAEIQKILEINPFPNQGER
jgi:ArsR family metal-binding transcriptional regulator